MKSRKCRTAIVPDILLKRISALTLEGVIASYPRQVLVLKEGTWLIAVAIRRVRYRSFRQTCPAAAAQAPVVEAATPREELDPWRTKSREGREEPVRGATLQADSRLRVVVDVVTFVINRRREEVVGAVSTAKMQEAWSASECSRNSGGRWARFGRWPGWSAKGSGAGRSRFRT